MKRPLTMIREYDSGRPLTDFRLFSYIRPRSNGEVTIEVWGAMRHKTRKNHPLIAKKYFTYRSDSDSFKSRDVLYYDNFSSICGPHICYDKKEMGGRDIFRYATNCIGGNWKDIRGKEFTGRVKEQSLHPDFTTVLGGFDGTNYKYCAYNSNCGLSVKEYLDIWKKHPKAEIFSKMKCFQLIDERFLCDCEDNGFSKFVYDNKDFITKHLVRPSSIRAARRQKMTVADYVNGMNDRSRIMYSVDFHNYCVANQEVIKKFDMSDISVYTAKKKGISLEEYGERYLLKKLQRRKAEDARRAAEWLETKKKKNAILKRKETIQAKRLAAIYDTIKTLAKECDAYELVIPTTKEQFEYEGKHMHNCIGGYFLSQFKTSVCLFLHKNGKPFVDLEIDYKTFTVKQVRKVENKDAGKVLWKIAEELAMRLKEFKLAS